VKRDDASSAAIFLLQQRGRVSLDAPVSNYLPDYVYSREMTLGQLLIAFDRAAAGLDARLTR
jgi:Beta-lactamase